MSEPTQQPSLPDRWVAAASDDPATDRAILQLIENSRTSASINETALLKAIVQHANEIAARADRASAPGTAGQDAGGEAA